MKATQGSAGDGGAAHASEGGEAALEPLTVEASLTSPPETPDPRQHVAPPRAPHAKGHAKRNASTQKKGSEQPEKLVVAAKNVTPLHEGVLPPRILSGLTIDAPLVICAEPDMGKSYAVDWIMRAARSQGWQTHRYSFNDASSDKAAKHVVRTMRMVGKQLEEGHNTLVVIDGVTPGDEYESASSARAIERLRALGCQIIVCVRPEMEQLAEALPAFVCLHGDDLLYRFDDHEAAAWKLTGGIGSLVHGLRGDEAYEHVTTGGTRYLAALERYLEHMLRPSLPCEDRALRLAALLLGSGTLKDLAFVSGRCDLEQLAWLGREVALFEVDGAAQSFTSYATGANEILSLCLGLLQRQAASYPSLVVRACGVLAARGEARRAALVCSLCSSEDDFVNVGITWGVSFVEAGELSLVAEALRVVRACDTPPSFRAQLGDVMVQAFSGGAAAFDTARARLEGLTVQDTAEQRLYRTVTLVASCREMWRDPRQAEEYLGASADDQLGALCLDHLHVVRMLGRGSFNEAYSHMSNEMMLPQADNVVSALLLDDLRMALLLSGGVPDSRERHAFEQADDFFGHASLERVRCYHEAVLAVPEVLLGITQDAGALEEAVMRSDRAGDWCLQALCLAVLAVADLRIRAWSRAHVRAEKAAVMARDLEQGYLASVAGFIDAVALEMLGERDRLGQWCAQSDHPSDLAPLGALAACQLGELPNASPEAFVPLGTSCPRDLLWLLALVAFDCQAFSDQMLEALPSGWLEQARALRARQMVLAKPHVADEPPVNVRAMPDEERLGKGTQAELVLHPATPRRVQVKVLSGFRVEVDGTTVPDSCFERRRSRDLMFLLAIVPGHRLRRYQAIDILWPDADYYRGPRKLYEATGEARKHMSCGLSGFNPLLADRNQGTVGFDAALVSCDVDDFEHEARLTLSEDRDDFWVLEHARKMYRIYGSGPDPHLSVLGERIVDRLDELESLFADASVAAGEAALRLGKTKLAVRYATDVHRLRPLREDAMILLVEALRAAGRSFEIPALYRRFARQLIEEEGMPPSLALRRAVALASNDSPEALSA